MIQALVAAKPMTMKAVIESIPSQSSSFHQPSQAIQSMRTARQDHAMTVVVEEGRKSCKKGSIFCIATLTTETVESAYQNKSVK